jgi:hypothetical protein
MVFVLVAMVGGDVLAAFALFELFGYEVAVLAYVFVVLG